MLKELGCRLKSIVYQKAKVSRKEILNMFRKKEAPSTNLTKRKPKSVSLIKQSAENNWRRRIYDALNVLQNSGAVNMDEKTIRLPDDKRRIVFTSGCLWPPGS